MRRSSARWLREHPVAGFFALACLISWTIWLPLVLDPRTRAIPGQPWYALHFLGLIGPMLAAFIVAQRLGAWRKAAFRRRLSPGRVPPGWLAAAWLLPFGLYLLAAASLALVGRGEIDLAALGRFEKLPGLGLVGAWLLLLAISGPGEETGWRGWALPLLQERHSPLVATLAIVPGWALWHLPMFVYDPVFAAMGIGGIVGWLVSLAAGAVVLTWLFNASGGNVIAPTLFHAATNAVFMSAAATGVAGAGVGALVMVLAVGLLIRDGPSLGLSPRPRTATPP